MHSANARKAVHAAMLCAASICLGQTADSTVDAGVPSPEARADQQVPGWLSLIELHGYVDTYYSYNFNRPADGESFIPGTGTSAKQSNEFSLNLAAVDLGMKPAPVGFRLILNVGTGTQVVHAGEPVAPYVGPAVWDLVQQASVIWEPTTKLHLEAGIYPSHIGFEVLPSKDNWNYTRGWMGEFSPYYQAGVMAKYAFTEHFSAQLHLINGWQIIADNNQAKTIGTQLAWNYELLSIAFNTAIGPELPNDNDHWRFFGDLVASFRPTSKLSLGLSIDAALQQVPATDSASWQGAALFARYALSETFALAARGEIFRDPDAQISGFPQQLWEGTGTLEVRPVEALIVKLEGRYDRSTANVFGTRTLDAAGNPDVKQDQLLVLLGAVAAF